MLEKVYGLGVSIQENSDLNTYRTPGVYFSAFADVSVTLENTPWTESGFRLEVKCSIQASSVWQLAYKSNESKIAMRTYLNGIWSEWIIN